MAPNIYRSGNRSASFGSAGERIRIVRIIGRLNIGGPAIHVVNLTAGLDPTRFEQTLVVGSENPLEGSMMDYAFSQRVRPVVIPEIVTAFSLTPRDVKALSKLYTLIRRERPHIVHTHTAKAGFLGRLAALLASVPIVVHTFHGHVLHGYYGPQKNWLLRKMEKSLARFTDQLVAVSEEIKGDLIGYRIANAEKISVIPLGLDLQRFFERRAYVGQFRREIGARDGTKLVGIVGRIFPIKNHSLFLESAARVLRREPTACFIIVGDGVLRPALERQARELGIFGRVIFTGWRRDLPCIYADLDVLVVSSDNEGTPVSAIEAMASGCPVVATRVGGLPDIITNGKNGLLVPPRDPEQLAGAILYVLHHPESARSLAQSAVSMAQKRFTLQRLIADIGNLYGGLLDEKLIGGFINGARTRKGLP